MRGLPLDQVEVGVRMVRVRERVVLLVVGNVDVDLHLATHPMCRPCAVHHVYCVSLTSGKSSLLKPLCVWGPCGEMSMGVAVRV